MRYFGVVFAAALCAGAQANAACSGSVAASGVNLTMGTPIKLAVTAQAGCVQQNPADLTVGGTAPGAIVTLTPDATWKDYKFTPTAIGSGTLTFDGTGFQTLTVTVTVSPGKLDLVPGN